MDLSRLLREAQHSHRVYLDLLNFSHEKSIGLKWGDVAQSAISVITDKADEDQLRADLIWMVVKPIEILHQSIAEKILAKTNSIPAKAKNYFVQAQKLVPINPIDAKNLLIQSINDMFKTMEVLDGESYPSIEVLK